MIRAMPRTKRESLFVVVLTIAVAFAGCTPAEYAEDTTARELPVIDLAEGPARVAAIERTLEGAEQALAKAKDELKAAGKKHRELESDIDGIKSKISRYQDQLLEVKTNEQYRALNKEIAAEQGEIE